MELLTIILNASLIVQLVMLLLLLLSIVSWMMIIQRYFALRIARNQFDQFDQRFWSGVDLKTLYIEGNQLKKPIGGVENIFRAGFQEYNNLKQQNISPDMVTAGIDRAMRVALARETEKLENYLPFLASAGSISPYVGLFGTVFGIINTFTDIANMKQATLATVAPGISEALIATAMGLFVAIPAVLGYNKFSSEADNLLNRYETFAEELSGILLHFNQPE